MGAYLKQARLSLNAYLDRGVRVIDQLESGAWDTALETLMWREAAFQNFKVAYFMEMKASNDLSSNHRISNLVGRVISQNLQLEKEILRVAEVMRKDEVLLAKEKLVLAKFHSGKKAESQINSTV
tara:strand:+ start:235 stop:609 length:375 start_codon:yes stop_codon:yes gene_type:complete